MKESAMRLQTPLTRMLRVDHPIVLAAMDVVADARLAVAVMDAGGYAFLGAGYGDRSWLERELPLLAGGARGRPYGVGFITWSLAREPQLLDLALDARPDAIWLSFGDPAPFVARAKSAGAKVVCQVQSEAMARAALDAGADILVAQGAEAAGHGVIRGALALVPAIVDLACPRVPVVAAGGIADGRGLAAAIMLGAAGACLGTRFYATVEAAGHEAAKRRIVAATGDDTLRSNVFDVLREKSWPQPFTGRCIVNDSLRRWAGREADLARDPAAERGRYAAARESGDFDVAAVIAGEACGLIHEVAETREVIRRIVEEAAHLLQNGPRLVAEPQRREILA
jgi:nitronate monooxygenase